MVGQVEMSPEKRCDVTCKEIINIIFCYLVINNSVELAL